jgi:YidC/Oxa1 family membrane protein insertase
VKALQAKHKGDRETLNVELMKVYKEHGTNPVSGCLPMILQLPIFFALFRVMNEFRPKGVNNEFHAKYGLTSKLVEQGAHAKVFGAPISAAFNSGPKLLSELDGNATTVKIVAALMVVTMGLTTFITQKQIMGRTGAQMDAQQAQVQKIMLYVLPFSFAIFGFSFPIGVLLYWLTTNFWSMGQQRWVIARMPVIQPGGKPAAKPGKDAGKDTGKAPKQEELPAPAVPEQGGPSEGVGSTQPPGARPSGGSGNRPGGAKSSGSRKNKKRKGGRR